MAQGSVTIRVSNFNSVAELYDQIAKGFGVSAAAIIYCTRNTTRMEDLFTGILEADDLLLVHMRGQPYEIELVKTQVGVIRIHGQGQGQGQSKRFSTLVYRRCSA